MIDNRSHDSHVISPPTSATPPGTPPQQHRHSSASSTVSVQGQEHSLSRGGSESALPGLIQYPLNSDLQGDLPASTLSGLTQYPSNSDMHTGVEHLLPSSTFSHLTPYPLNSRTPTYGRATMSSNPALFAQYHSQVGATYYTREPREGELTAYDLSGPIAGVPLSLEPHMMAHEKSDVFAGTSQAYSSLSNVHEGYFNGHPNALIREPRLDSLTVANHDEHQDQEDPTATAGSSSELDELSPSLQQMGLRQLGVLFKARGRHIAELTRQISAQAEDNERHIKILRHEKVSFL